MIDTQLMYWLLGIVLNNTTNRVKQMWINDEIIYEWYLEYNKNKIGNKDITKRYFNRNLKLITESDKSNIYRSKTVRSSNKRYTYYLFISHTDDPNKGWPYAISNLTIRHHNIVTPERNVNHSSAGIGSFFEQSPLSRRDQQTSQTGQIGQQNNNTSSNNPPNKKRRLVHPPILSQFIHSTYWDSVAASQCFGLVTSNPEEIRPIEYIVKIRLEKLRMGFQNINGWRSLLGDNQTKIDILTSYDVYNIRSKCRFVSTALNIALKTMHIGNTWHGCCKEAVREMKGLDGNKLQVSFMSIARWHKAFRSNNESFWNPNYEHRKIEPSSPILEDNPDLRRNILMYAKDNLTTFNIESALEYIHAVAIPLLLKKRRREMKDNNEIRTDEEYTLRSLLKEYGLVKICRRTVCNWLSILGFKYKSKTKTFYVDGHEKIETVIRRKEYINNYLIREIRCFRWIQLKEGEVEKLEKDFGKDNIQKTDEYRYVDDSTKLTMYEFHVDVHECLKQYLTCCQFGGNLSIRKKKEEKPIINFGQDECIYKQYQFNNKQWYLPDGTSQLLPKDEGQGIMYSSFVSRDFGYGMEMSQELLDKTNVMRIDKSYSDIEAAMNVFHGEKIKKKLTQSPFVRSFYYGKNNEGYWNYDHMVIQLEDCVDVLNAKYGKDTYNFFFYFDHSTGHDRSRPDGLNESNMNKKYGGKKNKFLHDSVIIDETYLGEFVVDNKLKVGDTQVFTFTDKDVGPYWMDDVTRLKTKYDVAVTGSKIKKTYTTSELVSMVNDQTDVNITRSITYTEAKSIALLNGVPTSCIIDRVAKGWINQPKGIMQVLWERGFIDPLLNINKDYTEKGRKNEDGIYDENFSYVRLISNLPDFKAEMSLLHYHARKLGVYLDSSPKCHPEIAGEGIEYCWGASKQWYRALPIKFKRDKKNFNMSVTKAMDRSNILTVDNIRKFVRRQRSYMLAYLCLDVLSETSIGDHCGTSNPIVESLPNMSCSLVERVVRTLKKRHKSHRNVLDQETSFLWCVREDTEVFIDTRIDIVKKELADYR